MLFQNLEIYTTLEVLDIMGGVLTGGKVQTELAGYI